MFDFVRDVIPVSVELGFADTVEDVLKETLTKNTSKNFGAWFERITTGCEGVPTSEVYMNFDIDDLDALFSDFHNLDHAHHHRVWCDKSHSILYQFKRMFIERYIAGKYQLIQLEFVFEKDFRTLRKYVPSIKDYMERYYKESKHGVYNVRGDDDD